MTFSCCIFKVWAREGAREREVDAFDELHSFLVLSSFSAATAGGGWCSSNADCAARAFDGPVYANEPSLGSSKLWGPGPCTPALANSTPPCVADGGSGGLLSSNATINPLLASATKVGRRAATLVMLTMAALAARCRSRAAPGASFLSDAPGERALPFQAGF